MEKTKEVLALKEVFELKLDLNQVVTDFDDEPITGQDIKGRLVPLSFRVCLQWVLASLPPEQHTKFEIQALTHDLLPQLKPSNDMLILDDKDNYETLKQLVSSCVNLTALPKNALQIALNVF